LDSGTSEKSFFHHGVVVDTSTSGFDKGVASFCSIFVDEDYPRTLFLYYAGGQNERMINSAIGLAVSKEGIQFEKVGRDPVFSAPIGSFCHMQAQTPAVTKLDNRFYMVLSGKPSLDSPRRVGIAYADDPKGPWNLIGELIKPAQFWEGNGIDNGPSIVQLDNETILLYYSSITSTRSYDIGAIIRRYPIRRIGLLKIRIRGTSPHKIEAMRFSGNPIKHLNGPKGRWNESVFCPGCLKLNDMYFLFPSTSTYSVGFPYRQYIGATTSNSPYFHPQETSKLTKLIDGPSEKNKILPNIKGEIALDTPSPYFDADRNKLFLYYSAADRADGIWKTALTTFDLTAD